MKTLILFCSSILISLSVWAVEDTTSQKTKQKDFPKIEFSTLEYNFGTIAPRANGTCEFEFTNTGTLPLIINRASASCGCTVPSYPTAPIPPGGKGVIKVTYDTNRIGPFAKSVSIGHNGENYGIPVVILTVRGEVSSNIQSSKNESRVTEVKAVGVN